MSVFDKNKNYTGLVHKQGEIRYAKDENHRQDIVMGSITNHIKNSFGFSRKTISYQNHIIISWIRINYAQTPSNGLYKFEFETDSQVKVYKDLVLVDTVNIIPNQKYIRRTNRNLFGSFGR